MAQAVQFFQGQFLFAPDPSVGTIVADFEELCNLMHKREIIRNFCLNLLKKELLKTWLLVHECKDTAEKKKIKLNRK